ncbi:serine hydroxymethyltransferase [Pseudomonas syringae]|uniref:Putative Serine hydroxymethyltransferase n=1 Tax=Pseudomonas syringae pv. apii TaxID=81036 RepID=A0A3M3S133_9PSED|nr:MULTISPECIES: serine hydroxymethyltransferase [Pseudomonas syringae group]RMN44278.1 putative Serine hydroxymethyltransferase [Pseudomonas syringae pv. apii]RMN44476.1 putative Serine hydroxymethyltransferase [Pseudomonas syringae pv. apii]RMO02172.1 putative Serine hydroxymethyltransferase [Pseudomonas syringae pv. apii]SDZ12519.1 serine hydroxymethyltransferase [Pseudomonas syringae]
MREFEAWTQEMMALGAQQENYESTVINLIASDNASPRHSSPFYKGQMIQEGVAGKRPFAGARFHDEIERTAALIACRVFNAEHANLQPHSCSQANQSVYHALLEPGDNVLALNFKAGGHLTHGHKVNFSGMFFNFRHYGVDEATDLIDYDLAEQDAIRFKPKLIVCGSSSYPRLFDARRLREISDKVGALLMFDLSHEAGLIASGAIPNPVPLADVATMSMDKTMRGAHGAIILCTAKIAQKIDKGVHPGTQSSFPISRLTQTAQALLHSQTAEFREYANRVLDNALLLEQHFLGVPNLLVTGGTDKHYLVLNTKAAFGIDGVLAEQRLEAISVLSSRQTLPGDRTSRIDDAGGIRLGTAWITSRGYELDEVSALATIIIEALSPSFDDAKKHHLLSRVNTLIATDKPKDVWRNS